MQKNRVHVKIIPGERVVVVVTLGCYKLSKPDGMPENLSEIVTLGLQFTLCWYNAVSVWSSCKASCALHD